MTLNKENISAEIILQKTTKAMVFCLYLVFAYVALQASLYLRDYMHAQFVYNAAWENTIRSECKSFKGCKSVSFERNSFIAEAGPSFAQIFRPQVIAVYQFDRSVITRSMASEFADAVQSKNPNLFIKIN